MPDIEAGAWPAIALEGRTDGENIIALFYEVRQTRADVSSARREFQKHIDEDRKAFEEVRDALKDIKDTLVTVHTVSSIAGKAMHSLGYLLASGGIAGALGKHFGWW